MSEALRKLCSAIIVAFIVASGTQLNTQQLSTLYRLNYWDGTTISMKNGDSAVVENGILTVGEEKVTVGKVNVKEEIIAYSSKGYFAVRHNPEEIVFWHSTIGNYTEAYHLLLEDSNWYTKVDEKYIYVYTEKDKLFCRIDLESRDAKFYQ